MMKNLIERRKPELVEAMDVMRDKYPHSYQRLFNSMNEKVSIIALSYRDILDLQEMMVLDKISFSDIDNLFNLPE